MLVTNYAEIREAYSTLPDEGKEAFLKVFEGYGEEEFAMGPYRAEMMLDCLEADEHQPKLDAINALINQYST